MSVYYVRRAKHGAITHAWTTPQFPTQEAVPASNSALLRFINASPLGQRLSTIGLTPDDIAQLAVRVGLFVTRDADGRVVDATDAPSRDGQEMLPIDDQALQAFLAPAAGDDAA